MILNKFEIDWTQGRNRTELCGFAEDAETRKDILLSEDSQRIQMHKGIYLCFIDYRKTFDRVGCEKLLKIFEKLTLHEKDFQLIRYLC